MPGFFASFPSGGSSGNVTSLNGLQGALTLLAGSGISITPSGSNITIAATGGSSANQQLSNLSGTVAANLSISPGSDNSLNLGSGADRWANLFATSAGDGTRFSMASTTVLRLSNQAADPGSGLSGDVYYNSTGNAPKYFNGSAWVAFAASPTGNANTSAYFDNTGALASNTQAIFNSSTNSRIDFQGPATVTATGVGAYVHANSSDPTGSIQANGDGALAQGMLGNSSSVMASNGRGSIAAGFAQTGGIIFANGSGSIAVGETTSGGELFAAVPGALVHGSCSTGTILATGNGAHAHGQMSVGGGAIQASGAGSYAGGLAAGFTIVAQGDGSRASGTDAVQAILASGLASFAHGSAHTVSADYGTALGIGNNNSSYASLSIGRYADPASFTPTSWVATDPVFVAGNGTGVGTEATAYRMDKDGRILETGANRVPVRILTGTDTLSARSDRKLLLNGTGALTLNLPAGEEGLCYQFGLVSGSTGVWTLAPNGGDTVNATIATINSANGIIFHSGTWYQCY